MPCLSPKIVRGAVTVTPEALFHVDQTNYHDQNESKVNTLNGHSELSENFRNEHDHDYEEPYWELANKEEELMDQLSRLGVPEILVESIEYVL